MTRTEAAEIVHARQLYVSAGPAPVPKGSRERRMSWAVATTITGDPRGIGETLEGALADMLRQESLGDLL